MITLEQSAEIRRLFFAEHWSVGTISKNCNVHPDVVKRVIDSKQFGRSTKNCHRDSMLDPFRVFLLGYLELYPKIKASRLKRMIEERGYRGSVYPVRRFVAKQRVNSKRVFQELIFLPGEQAQVDWASLGKTKVDGAVRRLECFVMVLSYSRLIFAKIYHDQTIGRVLEGHAAAFKYFGGVPRIVLYDNMKTAVIENFGKAVRFNDSLLDLSAHYHFQPRACNPRSAWEKGRVERAIQYIRSNFMCARSYTSLDDLNDQLRGWIDTTARERAWPDDTNRTVGQVFSKEEKLLPLPQDPYLGYEEKLVRSTRQAFFQFDANRYSVPAESAAKSLTVRATHSKIVVYDGGARVCEHLRSWGKGQKISNPDHIESVAKASRASSNRRSRNVLGSHLGEGLSQQLYTSWAESGDSLGASSSRILGLIKQYGQQEVAAAINQAIELCTPRADSICYLLEKNHYNIPEPIQNPNFLRKDLSDFRTESHDLSTYDEQ